MLSCEPKVSAIGERIGYELTWDCSVGLTEVIGVFGAMSTISNSGVNLGIMHLQVFGRQPPGDGGGFVGVCLRTISCHLSQIGSVMWSFQLTAARKAISLVLISQTLSPEILLHARAE